MSDESEYDAVVYDLDGTLVSLDVDWDAVARDVEAVYAEAGVDDVPFGLWEMLAQSDAHGLRAEVEAVISDHEREGARSSRRLPLADQLSGSAGSIAVCSLNSEAACRVALETHGLSDAVDAVVGRDTAETYKPDPESLLAAIRALGADPERTLFVGDGERDETTAERAGVAFRYVGEWPREG